MSQAKRPWSGPVLRSLPPAAPPASPVAPALAHARGMLGRVLYAAAFFLLLIYTMDSQPTDKVEGVGDDFVRGGQDKTPIKPKRKRIVVTALPEAHAEVLCRRRQR